MLCESFGEVAAIFVPFVEENERFYSHNTAVLQDFLMKHGKLPVNHEFDSLGIGTLQGYLKKLGYYHG